MYIRLQKTNERGGTQLWEFQINDEQVITVFGQIGGKMRTEEKDISDWSPKNVGRANETSSLEQASFEMIRKARKKIDSGYSVIYGAEHIEELTSKTVVKTNLEIPKPTLAKNASPYSTDHKNSMRKILAQKEVIEQPKLDGNRAFLNRFTGEVYSRTRKLIPSVPHLAECINIFKDLPEDVVFIDGELYSDELTFNEIQSIIRKSRPDSIDIENAKKIKFNVFDYVSDEPQIDRLNLLKIVNDTESHEYVNFVPFSIIKASLSEIQKVHDKHVEDGHEGVMIRFLNDGGYQQKRSNSLYKFKNFVDDEFLITGIYSEKNDVTKLGGFNLIMDDGKTFDARPSCTQEEAQYMMDHPDEFIGKYATVRYQKLDEVKGTPIFGTIKGFRAENDIDTEVEDED